MFLFYVWTPILIDLSLGIHQTKSCCVTHGWFVCAVHQLYSTWIILELSVQGISPSAWECPCEQPWAVPFPRWPQQSGVCSGTLPLGFKNHFGDLEVHPQPWHLGFFQNLYLIACGWMGLPTAKPAGPGWDQ